MHTSKHFTKALPSPSFSALHLAIRMALCTTPFVITPYAYADGTQDDSGTPSTTFETLVVTADRGVDDKKTTANRVVKTSETLSKQQVNDVRDITRYDPGIAVNEQGTGTSAGYSIRGVEKDRVAITVDGLAQAQSFSQRYGNTSHSGAKNEIEIENIKSIDITQGANSVLSGNGAMGGAVMFTTKDPEDVIHGDKNWGVDYKAGYTSKDSRYMQSLASAGRIGKFSALVQYTHRKGHEIATHKDTPYQTMNRLFPKEGGRAGYETLREGGYSAVRPDYFPQSDDPNDNLTGGCTGAAIRDCEAEITLAPNDVYGPKRGVANPMDYESKSLFGKLAYDFSPALRVGLVAEETKQSYELENRSNDSNTTYRPTFYEKGDNRGNNRDWEFRMLFPNYQYIDQAHKKQRVGLFADYQHPTGEGWLDKVKFSVDHETIEMSSTQINAACTLAGETPNKNCTVFERNNLVKSYNDYCGPGNHCQAKFKDYQHHERNRNTLKENNLHFRLSADKYIGWLDGRIEQNSQWLSGYGKTKYNLTDRDINNTKYDFTIPDDHPCRNDDRFGCATNDHTINVIHEQSANIESPIHGSYYFLGLNNDWRLYDRVGVNAGLRYDDYRYRSDSAAFKNDKYTALSWSAGANIDVVNGLNLRYQAGTGFRVPNAQELYGTELQRDRKLNFSKLEPEEAFNQELGLNWSGRFGYLDTSVYRADYTNMIVVKMLSLQDAAKVCGDANAFSCQTLYYGNQQSAKVEGVNTRIGLNLSEWHNLAPKGLTLTAAYSRSRPRELFKTSGDSSNLLEEGYALNALQPAKTVVGLDYDAPTDRWGVGLKFTHSAAKNAEEVVYILPNQDSRGERVESRVSFITKPWYTWDLTGYVNLNKNITLRGGVYNLSNAKYITWESARQAGNAGVDTAMSVNVEGYGIDRLTSTGRNYALSLEMKF
ncbi:MAG: lactoferrin/transferrin family TonB-dependent receptor [Moraxella sp.]|nr:lactoferrin/transferrin family TonB-dependent receptor [Moraxella sp.]